MENRPPSQRPPGDRSVDAGDSARAAGGSAPRGAGAADDPALESAIRSALFDVSVPEGLLARLAPIPDFDGERDVLTEAIATTPESAAQVELAKQDQATGAKRIARRTAIGVSLALAAAASVAAVLLYQSATDFDDWNRETLARRAISWTLYLEQEPKNRDAWRPIEPEQAERSLGVWLRREPDAIGDYWLTGSNDRRFRGDVYRFGSAEKSQAMLYVVDAATLPDDLPSSPPSAPDWTSEGFAVGVWRRGDHLYVVAVRGDADDYARLIRRQVVA